ncbi:MAG: carbohydrate ABC transporter permease [Defluviitaleaceae bacterium]|nr:carbohydrate ABC transporter permease [Defluviitaleaceae bacterium]
MQATKVKPVARTGNPKQIITKCLCYVFLVTLFLICFVPVYMLLVNATRSNAEINRTFSLIPGGYLLHNWQIIQNSGINMLLGFRNSVIIAFSTTFLSIYFSLMTAYGINVYNFRFKRQFYALILIMVLVPGQLYLIGFFQYVSALGLINTFWPLIIPAIAAPGTVFFMKQYLDAALVPELIQAARIDGANEFSIFNKIALPLAAPGAFTFAIFTFVGSWNAFMAPLFILGARQDLHTLPLLMNRVQAGGQIPDQGAIYFGMAATLIPIIIIYAIFSKYIVSGVSLGSVKE